MLQRHFLRIAFKARQPSTLFHKMSASKPFTVLVEGNIGSGKTTFLEHFRQFDDITLLTEPVEEWRNLKGYNLLDLMYKDPSKWAMAFQAYVSLTMLDMHRRRTPTPVKLMERSIFSARYCFVEHMKRAGMLHPAQFAVLEEWFQFMKREIPIEADLIVNSTDSQIFPLLQSLPEDQSDGESEEVDRYQNNPKEEIYTTESSSSYNDDSDDNIPIVYLKTTPSVVYERIKKRARSEEQCVPLSYIEDLHKLHEDWLVNRTHAECPAPVLVLDADLDLCRITEEYKRSEHQILKKAVCFKLIYNIV